MKPFDFWSLWKPEITPWEVVVRAAAIYVFLQLLLRIAGRKELGEWGISDVALLFLITIAVRNSIVANDTSLTSAMIGLATIVALDWLVSHLCSRSTRLADVIEGPVRQLVRDGQLLREAMRRTRVSEDDLLARVREKGKRTLEEIQDAFLERSGKITIIFRETSSR
jgi:uncharacterized membrane protein YcaP (DUF421 family)